MKKHISVIVLILLAACLLLVGCGSKAAAPETAASESAVRRIRFENGTAVFDCGGVSFADGVLTISAVGEYYLSGELENGRVVINTGDEKMNVSVYLDGVSISHPTDSAFYVARADKVKLYTVEGTKNVISSGTEEQLRNYSPENKGAAIYAEDDIDFKGEGMLLVNGYINNGITCKDDIEIDSGTIVVTAANNGIRASESITVKAGYVGVSAGNDGLKTTSSAKAGKGFVSIEGGELEILSNGDGISAETELTVSGGSIDIRTIGDTALVSSKGLKAKTALSILGGSIVISSTDDAVHCDASISISGGTLELSSATEKGVCAGENLSVLGGSLICRSGDDGLEAKGNIDISDGELLVYSGKNGINAGDKNTLLGSLSISGGKILCNASKNGLKAIESITVSGGTILVLDKAVTDFFAADSPLRPISASVKGAVGTIVSVEGVAEISAEHSFNRVLLVGGDAYSVSVGGERYELN